MVKNQLKVTREIVNICEIVERLIMAFSERKTRNGAGPLVSASCERTSKLLSEDVTASRAMRTDRFVVGSTAAATPRSHAIAAYVGGAKR